MVHCTDDIISNARQSCDKSSGDVIEAAQTIAFCTHHIKTIADDVIQMSKLDSRLVEINPTSIRPREVVEQAIAIFQSERKAGSIELDFKEDPSIEAFGIDWLLLDSVRYLQILFNMVTNAIKVVKNRPTRKIEVKLSAASNNETAVDSVRFAKPRHPGGTGNVKFGEQYKDVESVFLVTTVEDTGPGLTEDELSSLFERFAQASPKTESKYGGSGLGLFISRDLTELQGGRIGVASEAGVGSKFVFSVESKRCEPPKTKSDPPPIRIPARLQAIDNDYSPVLSRPPELPNGQEATRSCADQKEKAGPRRVLVVEDNLINQKVLANQLRKRGYEVSVALHGEEALKQLHMNFPTSDPLSIPRKAVGSRSFDVVLLDIEMPVMDGITCVQRIRAFEAARPNRRRLNVIAVTANARGEHETAALAAGMDSITTKPYKIESLVQQMEKACSPAAG
ncbi:related to sensory transduction histidine kinase [Ramularia collo-cygni]|uniref:Related to sensory transduction histidine kinase n=1 Tax=Ramularia collo-cygni TaxID=112498 RepID=A0A2D3UXW7_9PEZI|nr:related to sensory transduction histidine kinase [Ramularia collo-cygni]CZT17157.1 related to sensory transduction histidine kinase [Ramularia collo-cygni]